MAEFLERLGHRIIQSKNAWWYDVRPGVLLSFPYYKLVEPQEEEIEALMRRHKLRAIRYPTTLNSFGFPSNLALNTNQHYDLGCQHQKARNQTRRGVENCVVEEVDFSYLSKGALSLNQDTARRQGRQSPYGDPDYWNRYCQAARATPEVSGWGAFFGGRLAAFLVAIEVDDWAEWVINHSSSALLNKYPNNALVFRVAQHFFQERHSKGICYGLGSLESTPALDRFKQRMGWELKPIKQRLVFSRSLEYAFLPVREPCLKVLSRLFPRSYTARKVSAMIRLYRKQTHDLPPTGA
jgi:hypothetical protein